jgi:hypothetical protein
MDTVEQALSDWGSRRCQAVLYISKPENLWRDIEPSQRIQVIRRVDNAGRDHESVYEISNTMREVREAKEEWCLVQPPYWNRPSWVEDTGDDYWHNLAGGRCPKGEDDKILGRRTVASYRDLDWREAYHVEGSDSGWLSPAAEFYPCESRVHDAYADLVLHSTPDALDKLNWIRVYNAPGMNTSWTAGNDWICVAHHPTEAQVRWLEDRGHTLTDYDRGSWD